jgi:formate dehydrogenase maturation protein FdhE
MSLKLCDKCGKKPSIHELGTNEHHNRYGLCNGCWDEWTVYNKQEPYNSQLDKAHGEKFRAIWEFLFQRFLGIQKERVSFT